MTSLQTWWWSPQVLAALEDAERDRSGVAWTVRRQWTYQAGHSAFSIGDSSIAAKRESVRSLSSFRGCSCSMPQLGRTEPTEDTKDLHAIKEELVSSSSAAAAAANDPCMNTLVRALLGREDCRFDDAIARIYALHRGARGGLRGRLHVRSSAEARRLLRMGVSVDAYAMLGNLFSRGIGVSKFSSREWRVLGVGSQSSVLVCVLSGGDSWKTQRSRLDVSDEELVMLHQPIGGSVGLGVYQQPISKRSRKGLLQVMTWRGCSFSHDKVCKRTHTPHVG